MPTADRQVHFFSTQSVISQGLARVNICDSAFHHRTFRIYHFRSTAQKTPYIMAPKLELDENTSFIFAVLSAAEELKVDWKKANVKVGMSRADSV